MEWELCQTQRSNDKFLTAIHHHGIVTNDEHGVVFRCPNHIFCRLNKDITFAQLKEKAERKINPEGASPKQVQRIRYRQINCQDDGSIYYSVMDIRSDHDVRTMMEAHANVPSGRQILELYIDMVKTPEEIMNLLRQPPTQPTTSSNPTTSPQQTPPNKPVLSHACTLYFQGRMYYNEKGVYFESPNIIRTCLKNNITTFNELRQLLSEQATPEGEGEQEITNIEYRSPRIRDGFPIDWSAYTIKTDDDVKYMFSKHQRSKQWTRSTLDLCIETTLATDYIIRRVIPPVIQWPLPENVWWKN